LRLPRSHNHSASNESSFGPPVGAVLLNAHDLSVLWCNETYRRMLAEPVGEADIPGTPFTEISPMWGMRLGPVMREVAETGAPARGHDCEVDIERGPATWRWSIERPEPGILLALIDVVCGRPVALHPDGP